MSAMTDPNEWRRHTPGSDSWPRSPRPAADNKFFIVSADCHVQEPNDFLSARMPAKYAERLPGIVLGGDGSKFQKTEGFRPIRLSNLKFEGEDLERAEAGMTPEQRLAADRRDGIDCEILFPNKGLTIWATPDAEFSLAMCRAYNDWAWETFGPYNNRLSPMACVAPGALDGTLAEIERCAKLGFRGLSLPCKPVFGPPNVDDLNYNLKEFEPLWAAIVDVDLPVTFHVSTGRDPRTARSQGGAVINYTVHSLSPTMEPLVNLCASGVAERYPSLRFGSIEAGIGWVPWMLEKMDQVYLKHHFWVRPKLKALPSEYYHANCFASFGEDKVAMDFVEKYGLEDNLMWANDFPHHEGTWPYSAQAIERTFGPHLSETTRVKLLGLNAARVFRFDIPDQYKAA